MKKGGENQTLVTKIEKVLENVTSSVLGEFSLLSFTCQLKVHLYKQVTNGSMLPNAHETPNYFNLSIPH